MVLDPDLPDEGIFIIHEEMMLDQERIDLQVRVFDENSLIPYALVGDPQLRAIVPQALRSLFWPSQERGFEVFEILEPPEPWDIFRFPLNQHKVLPPEQGV